LYFFFPKCLNPAFSTRVWFLQLSTAGGRIILCSDGVWDALSAEMALDCCRGMSPEAAATHIVKVRSSFAQFFNAIVSPCNLCHFVVCITCFYFYHLFLSLFFLQESVQAKGLRDDTTCIVIDILPQEKPPTSVLTQKKPVKGMLKSIFRKKSSESSSFIDKEYLEPDVVQELYEEGSAMLSERFDGVTSVVNVSILLSSYVF